jgi:hypothetical protein
VVEEHAVAGAHRLGDVAKGPVAYPVAGERVDQGVEQLTASA